MIRNSIDVEDDVGVIQLLQHVQLVLYHLLLSLAHLPPLHHLHCKLHGDGDQGYDDQNGRYGGHKDDKAYSAAWY